MPDHTIKMHVPWQQLGPRDVTFEVHINGEKQGELHVSEGGLDWWPRGHSVNKTSKTWAQLARFMAE